MSRIPPWRFVLAVLLAVAVAVFGPDHTTTQQLFVINSAILVGIAAVGLNLVMGGAGQVSIGSAGFLAMGGFIAVAAQRGHIGFPFDILVAMVVAGVAGCVAGVPALRIRGLYLALATLALHYIVLYLAQKYQEPRVGAGAFLLEPVGSPRFWTVTGLACLAVTVLLVRRLMNGKAGRAWRMIREYEEAAAVIGVETTKYKLSAFVISSMIIGAVGGMQAHYQGLVSIDFYPLTLAVSFIGMIVIGGLDSSAGAIIGAFIITALPEYLPSITGPLFGSEADAAVYSAQVTQVVYGALLVVFLMYFRDGVAGGLRRVGQLVDEAIFSRRPGTVSRHVAPPASATAPTTRASATTTEAGAANEATSELRE